MFCAWLSAGLEASRIAAGALCSRLTVMLDSRGLLTQCIERDRRANLSDLLEAESMSMPSFLRGPSTSLTSLSIRWAVSRVATSIQGGHPFSGAYLNLRAITTDQSALSYSAQITMNER